MESEQPPHENRRQSFCRAQSQTLRNAWTRASSTTKARLGELEDRVPSRLRTFVSSSGFSTGCLIAILANAIFIGIHAQYQVKLAIDGKGDEQDDLKLLFMAMEISFCVFFTMELIFRFSAGPKSFLLGQDNESLKWNFFDTALVVMCMADVVLQQVGKTSSFGYIRIVRVLRLARVLRIIRVMRFFRSLRLMVYSIIHSMVSLLWVFLLLLSAMYVFSIFFLHSVLTYFQARSPPVEDDNLIAYFGTVPSSMESLFMAICGGRDWHEYFDQLGRVHYFCSFVFLFYIFFVVFGVLNVVTGAFVDSMRLVSEKDHDTVVDAEMRKVDTFRKDVTKMFQDADSDGSGTLSWEEFEAHLQDERVNAFFQSLQIDTSQARALFMLLDIAECEEVPIDKFVNGCMRMRGDAKSVDVNMLLHKNEKILCKINNFCEFAEDKFDFIEKEFHRIDQTLGIQPSTGSICMKDGARLGVLPKGVRRNSKEQRKFRGLHTDPYLDAGFVSPKESANSPRSSITASMEMTSGFGHYKRHSSTSGFAT